MFKESFLNYLEKKNYTRSSLIQSAGIVGIISNIILASIKLIVGITSNSIAIISDAANNYTDASSSIITIIGLKLSEKPRDKEHPLGHGRVEYISGLIISFFIVLTGFELLKTSISRIMFPEYTHFITIQLVVLSILIIGKILISRFDIIIGEKTNSDALIASGMDARMDVLASLLTVISALISITTGLYIDGYVGVILSLFIMYTGFDLIKDTTSNLIGKRPNKKLVENIKEDVLKFKPIIGAYDLMAHNYGPTFKIGILNLEFPDYITVEEAYKTMDLAQSYILKKYGIYLYFSINSVNTYNKNVKKYEKEIKSIITKIPEALTIYNFYYDEKNNIFRFTVIIGFDVKDYSCFKEKIVKEVEKDYPKSTIDVKIEFDYS
ncbi:cation diffusion facilitator family transporter [Methanobrevibacter sp. OttesenSCG-928-K11]|nr:cation diffusion facilitator family transporter [Methanobrevibacter sp. OttesenSCG-928-K11]MDL2271140.1 cation diffusion facilitator family transporter [Methanobrevibacter sp. OttesenSCG-928-I08]